MSEEMLTGNWVQENLSLVLAQSDKRPKLDRCDQIAVELKRAYALANPIWHSPHTHWARSAGTPTATIHDANACRWHEYVFAIAEVTKTVLNAANPGRIPPFGYSKDGPVVRFLVKAIPLITGEQATPDGVSQKLYRQLRRPSTR